MKPSQFLYLNIRKILVSSLLMTAMTAGAQTSVYYLQNGRKLENVKSVTRNQKEYIFQYKNNNNRDTIAACDVNLVETSLEGWMNPKEGLDDLLCMSDGKKYRGRVVRQVPGVSFTLKLKGENSTIELPANQLLKAKKVKRNQNKDYWEQRPYDNVVETQYAVYKGIIIEQNLGEDITNPDDDFIVIFTDQLRMKETIKMSDIRRFTIEYH